MDRQRAIELLKQKSKEAVYVASLPPNNVEYIPWRRNVEDILETTFGIDSTEYKRVRDAEVQITSNRSVQAGYPILIQRIQLEINSIIQKYERLGIVSEAEPRSELKSTTELPTDLFDKMQFHPKIIDASRALFKDEHYAQAIFEAFKAIENFVQDKSDLNLHGTKLMETVFNEENPIIKVPEAGHYYKDVQRGFKHLFVGAAQAIRNPKAHKKIIQKDPHITLQYLGFFSFLLKRIDYWEAGVS